MPSVDNLPSPEFREPTDHRDGTGLERSSSVHVRFLAATETRSFIPVVITCHGLRLSVRLGETDLCVGSGAPDSRAHEVDQPIVLIDGRPLRSWCIVRGRAIQGAIVREGDSSFAGSAMSADIVVRRTTGTSDLERRSSRSRPPLGCRCSIGAPPSRPRNKCRATCAA